MSRPVLITVNGTGSPQPFDWGFPGDIGRILSDPWNDIYAELIGPQVANKYEWQPVGYPAQTFPMGPSEDAGIDEVVNQWRRRPRGTKTALSGYSQGAVVVDRVWRDEVLNPRGRLNDRVDDVVAIVNFGDPMRAPGICNGNLHAGFPIPGPVDGFTTGGIAGPGDLKPEETPDFLLSCNNDGDLYGAAPVGDTPWVKETGVGHDETMIYNLVQRFNVNNALAMLEEALTVLGIVAVGGAFNLGTIITVAQGAIGGAFGSGGIPGIPATGAQTPDHVAAILLALLNGGLFVAHGFGPHGAYGQYVPAMVDFILSRA